MSSAAEPPSVRKLELAAVCVPCGFTKADFRVLYFSRGFSALMPLSADTPFTGTISGASSPSLVALAASWWLRNEKSSCSARVTAQRDARRSLLWPMTSPVENSAMAGASGAR